MSLLGEPDGPLILDVLAVLGLGNLLLAVSLCELLTFARSRPVVEEDFCMKWVNLPCMSSEVRLVLLTIGPS